MLNLFAEGIGVAVTVLVIDRWSKRREARRLRPVLLTALRDARQIYREGMRIVEQGLVCTVLPTETHILRDPHEHVLSPSMTAILDRLSISQNMNLLEQSAALTFCVWRTTLPVWGQRYVKDVDAFLERFSGVVEPEVYSAVHSLQTGLLQSISTRMSGVLSQIGPNQPFPGLISSFARQLKPLRQAIRDLETSLGVAHEDGFMSHEMFPRVIDVVDRHPVYDAKDAPFRP